MIHLDYSQVEFAPDTRDRKGIFDSQPQVSRSETDAAISARPKDKKSRKTSVFFMNNPGNFYGGNNGRKNK